LRGVAILCALCTGAVLVLHAKFGPFLRVESQARDMVMQMDDALMERFGMAARADPRLVYVTIDDFTMHLDGNISPEELASSPALSEMAGGFPWPHDVYAKIIDRFMQAGARVVTFDILLPYPNAGNQALKAALDQYRGHVVIGSNFADEEGAASTRDMTFPSKDLIGNGETDDRVGYVNFWPDPDGIIRTVRYKRSLADVFNIAENGTEFHSLAARTLEKAGYADSVPTGVHGLRFVRPNGPNGFTRIPLYTIFLKEWKTNYHDGADFKDKIILIGPYGNVLKDQLNTPYGLMDGPEIHLNAINDVLHHDLINVPSDYMVDLFIVAMGFAAFGLASIINRPIVLGGAVTGITVAYLAAAMLALNPFHWVLPFFGPVLTFDSSSVLALYWKWLLERKERSRMRRMFERFVSKDVVKEVVENRESFLHQLGGVRKPVAIMMTDLRNFTTMTEGADSTQLVAQLNEYFDAMVRCVFDTQGTVDKFVGDAILAVWGNIHSGGASVDATRAVQTGIEMLKALDKLNEDWPARGWPILRMGIGINFGEVIFGAIGSEQKAEPTVIGDAVNSASRLEGLTKEYGLTMLIGETVAELVRDTFHLQLIDFVRVKGKTRALRVYTVLGSRAVALDARTTAYLEKYDAAMGCYGRGDFDIACSQFREALEIKPDDSVATVYFERCAELAEQRPETWDGVFVMKSK
jgi:adenylate cyclase